MSDSKLTTGLAMGWVPVTDFQGRTRLEARWTESPHTNAPADVTHAA